MYALSKSEPATNRQIEVYQKLVAKSRAGEVKAAIRPLGDVFQVDGKHYTVTGAVLMGRPQACVMLLAKDLFGQTWSMDLARAVTNLPKQGE